MKKILSVLLIVVMLLSLVPAAISVSAETSIELDKIEVNTPWERTWTAETKTKYAYLTVERSGFYNINIKDFNRTGTLVFFLRDLDFEGSGAPQYQNTILFNLESFTQYTHNNIYLIAGHCYEFACGYGDSSTFAPLDANISIMVTETSYTPTTLTLGTTHQKVISRNARDWYELRTTTAGDYSFRINSNASYILTIFEKETGELAGEVDFTYDLVTLQKLKADTDYIIVAISQESSAKLSRITISKTATDIAKIDLIMDKLILADYGIDAETGDFSVTNFGSYDYKVTYSDKTTEILSYESLKNKGVEVSEIDYLGKKVQAEGEYFLSIGKQPFSVTYMNSVTSKCYLYVSSFHEWCEDIVPVLDYETLYIKYKDTSWNTEFWKFIPEQTNVYSLYFYDSWGYTDAKYTFFDEDNNVIPYKDTYGSWKLTAGKEYILRVSVKYTTTYTGDISFSVEPNRDHIHDEKVKVVTKATLSDSGKIDYKCSKCGYVAFREVIQMPYTFKLSTSSYTYDGKKKTPKVIIKNYRGENLIKDVDYTVTYPSGRTKIGTYKIKVKFKGNYSGTKTLSFKINPISVSKCKITLSTERYTYNGKTRKPTVSVKDSKGKKISSSYYDIKYTSGKKIGKYKITVKMKGIYSGTKNLYFTINPPKTSLSYLTAGRKSLKVNIKKQSSNTTGYQIEYSTSKTFKSKYTKSKTIKSYKTTSYTLKSLKANKTYYVRVRTYKTVGGSKCYSDWSSVKLKKTR